MVSYWTSFATTGVPVASCVLSWTAMTDDTGPYLKIGKTVAIGLLLSEFNQNWKIFKTYLRFSADNYLDEYSVVVRENKMGFNMVNDDFFASLVEISKEEKNGEDDNSQEEEEEQSVQSSRQSNCDIIANKSKKFL